MPVYHMVLVRLKPGVKHELVSTWASLAKGMVGKVPGLISVEANKPLPVSVPRAKGFDMAIVALLEKPEHIASYAAHPNHQEVSKLREQVCDDTLVYDLEF